MTRPEGTREMSEIVVLVNLVARPGRGDEAERLLSSLLAPSHADEGCILYSLHRAADDPLRFAFVERWASRELLEAHMASEHIRGAMDVVPTLFSSGPEIVVYDAIPGGTTAQGSLAGSVAAARGES